MKQKIQQLRWLLMSVMFMVGAISAGAATSTLTFTEKCNGSGTADDDVEWEVTSDGSESQFDNTKGIHYGTGSQAVQYIKLTTSGISGTITQIVVNASTASGVSATVGVTVGGSTFGGSAQSLSTTATNYTFSGSASGEIEVSVSKPSSATKALYVKSITVTYTSGSGKTDTQVTFPQESYSTSYPGSFSGPTATVKNATSGSTINGASVTYSSSDTGVASVNSSTGAVTLTGIGNTTISATYAGNNTYSGSTGNYTLNVADGRTATSMTFPSSSYDAVMGEAFTSPVATLSPSDAGSVTYSSSNTAAATVDSSTGEVELVGVGTTTITARFEGSSTYKGSSASYTLNVVGASGGSSYTWDLSTNSYSSASSDQVVWTSDFATMTANKAGSQTNANNYLGGDTNNRTSSRFYTNSTVTIAPSSGYKITSIVFEATSAGYANAFQGSTWTNATASVSNTTVTVTPTNGTTNIVATIGGTCGFTGVTVYYEQTGSSAAPDAPSLTASCTFWPKTIEAGSMVVTIAPTTTGSYVRYTTDGTNPSISNGTLVTTSQNLTINDTTTVKAIAYIGSSTSGIATATYTLGQTVNSIAEFKALAEGTEARLYLSPENNARVLHVSGSEIYVRDNTGAICIYLASSLQNPVPQHDWHVAGWIIGKYQPYKGLPEFVATSNTTTDYLAIAAPVTEEATEPVTISPNDFDNYKADWVKICDLRAESDNNVSDDAGNTFKVYNKYELNSDSYYQDLYDYALVDMTGLAVPFGTDKEIVPIYYNNKRPIIYVIDENKRFTRPNNNINNVTVRLVRTLSNENWNTFCIPFDLQDFDGSVRKYEHADGQTMVFVEGYIEAGKPYLVKPNKPIENPIYENITLSATPLQNIENGIYSFNGIYEPTNIYTEDRTRLFLKTDGYLYYPLDKSKGRLKGMRAYFVAPSGSSDVKVMIDDDFSTMIEVIPGELVPVDSDIYTISGQYAGKSMEGLPRGIYIMNGKKLLIK